MYTLAESRARTGKPLDSWWTVLLVDPVASRLVRFAGRRRWITPNRLTGLAALFGLGAAAGFTGQTRSWLIIGAVLFHLGCVAGRLRGGSSPFGAWFSFMFDRLRAVLCAAALMGGQYARTGEVVYLWLAALVIAVDLLRYLNAGQMSRVRHPSAGWEGRSRITMWLRRHGIRVHLVSGVEFEMFVFVVAPITGWIIGITLGAAALLAAFEVRLIMLLWRATRPHAAGGAVPRPPAPEPNGLVGRVPTTSWPPTPGSSAGQLPAPTGSAAQLPASTGSAGHPQAPTGSAGHPQTLTGSIEPNRMRAQITG